MILGKTWIAERYATHNLETFLLKLISCGQWYGLKTLPQPLNPKEPSSLEELTPGEDSSLKSESLKEHKPTSGVVSQQVVSIKDHEPASIDPQDEL